MSIERSREFDLKNGLVVLAHPRSCYFCDHLTDIFLDAFNGTPYMYICEMCEDGGVMDDWLEPGMRGECKHFVEGGECQ